MLKKKNLLIFSNDYDDKIALQVNLRLYTEFEDIFPYKTNYFIFDEIDEKLNLIERVIYSLSIKIINRIEPSPPEVLYLSEDELFREVKIFDKKYRLLQGYPPDNDILQLVILKDLLKKCIKNQKNLLAKFIDKKSEAYK